MRNHCSAILASALAALALVYAPHAVGATTLLFTTGPGLDLDIPDDNPAGVTATIDVPDNATIVRIAVAARVDHTFVGDLIWTLTGPDGTTVTLADRPGQDANNMFGDSADLTIDRAVIFGDQSPFPADTMGAGCAGTDDVVGVDCVRYFNPEESLTAAFAGDTTLGSWRLTIADNQAFDEGFIDQFFIAFEVVPIPAPPALLLLGSALVAIGRQAKRRSRGSAAA